MNIFLLDENPVIAASYMCDKHINKMVLESAQMLTNCFKREDLVHAPLTKTGNVRKYSHWNHPCSVWTRQSYSNMIWLLSHAWWLEAERLYRGFNPHYVTSFLNWVFRNVSGVNIPDGNRTPFPVAISPDSLCRQCPGFDSFSTVDKYRAYYIYDKESLCKWTRREKPEWFSKEYVKTLV